MNFSTYCLSVLEFEVVFLFSCVCACVCPSACLHSNVPKDMFYILYCCRDNSDNIYHHQLMWKTKSAPCGKNQTLVSVHITSKDSKGLLSSCFFFSSKTHSSVDQSAPKFVNSCPVINSLKWIVFPSNCIQLHTCFYCFPPHLSGIHELSHEKRKNNSFYKLEHVTYKSSLQSPVQL